MDFWTHLECRGVSKKEIEKMKEEEITPVAIPFMTDEELKVYLPKDGHRIAARTFASDKQEKLKCKEDKLKVLKEKMRLKQKKKGKEHNSSKADKAVEMGWANYSRGTYRGVRVPNFGGTKSLRMTNNASKGDLLVQGKRLFFPDGKSLFGEDEDFAFDIALDVKGKHILNAHETVQQTSKRLQSKKLRYYLLSKKIVESDSSDTSLESCDSIIATPSKVLKLSPHTEYVINADTESEVGTAVSMIAEPDSAQYYMLLGEESSLQNKSGQIAFAATSSSTCAQDLIIQQEIAAPFSSTSSSTGAQGNNAIIQQEIAAPFASTPSSTGAQEKIAIIQQEIAAPFASTPSSTDAQEKIAIIQQEIVAAFSSTTFSKCAQEKDEIKHQQIAVPFASTSSSKDVQEEYMIMQQEIPAGFDISAITGYAEEAAINTIQEVQANLSQIADPFQEDNEVFLGPHIDGDVSMDSTVPAPSCVRRVKLHRGQVFSDMLEYLMAENVNLRTDTIVIEMILPNGEREIAEDGGGVFRDASTEFWEAFQGQCTEGNGIKIPFIRHNMTVHHWEAIARFLCICYKQEKYFPAYLSPVCLDYCISGEEPKDEDIMHTFMNYITEYDRNILEQSLKDIEDVDMADLIDTLGSYECRQKPTKENMQKLLKEISNKVLIQEPAFIWQTWSTVFKEHLAPLLECSLSQVAENMIPSTRKVLNLLLFEEDQATTQQQCIFEFLRKYIKGCNGTMLAKFLRFCTGSDFILSKKITISMVKLKPAERRPVAHTCGCVLEVPEGYATFADLRESFNTVLNSGIWIMDIV